MSVPTVKQLGDRMSSVEKSVDQLGEGQKIIADKLSSLEKNAGEFQKTVVTMLSRFTQTFDNFEQRIVNLSMDVGKLQDTMRLVYCRPGMTERLVGDTKACAGLLSCVHRRNVTSSSMMSVNEIVADFEVNKRGDGQVGVLGGDCQAAAATSKDYFANSHSLMLPKVEECVMYSPSGASLSLSSGAKPAMDGNVASTMKAHKLIDKTCVWAPAASPPAALTKGYKHFVTSVTTVEGIRVAVDWNIGQFAQLPEDMVLFF